MAVTKFVGILQALLNTTLKRHWREGDGMRTDEDIKLALEMLKLATADRPIWVVADNSRIASDFIDATKIPGVHVWAMHQCEKLYQPDVGAHVIVLHTGGKTDQQKQAYESMMSGLKNVDNIDMWHVGVWRI